jgi:uncharacterized membrane protein
MVVHFPVAAWTVATGLLLLESLELAGHVREPALYANLLGIVTGVPAMLAGLLELASLPEDRALRETVGRHLGLASSAWLMYCVVAVLQLKALLYPAVAAAIPAFALLLLAGHAGARVVYHHGFPRSSNPR